MRRSRLFAVLASTLALLAMLALAAAWTIGVVAIEHETGYLAPVFTPDGKSVLAIRRDVRAFVNGFGREFFTPPADVRVRSDRFELVSIRLSDQRLSVIETFPSSPLSGRRIKAYHGSIFGVPHAQIRFDDREQVEFEISVTRHDSPLARTFVIRRIWNPSAGDYTTTAPWQEASTGMGGDVPQQIHGAFEVIAVPGDELMACAIAVLDRDRATATVLVSTIACRQKFPTGITAAVLAPLSRRADIERAESTRTTYADLIASNRAAGAAEGQAMLDAGKEMQRRGLFPKSTTVVATPVSCDAATPAFSITTAEFKFGLFQDIEAAIERPGVEVEKSIGEYVTHRDYATSREINKYLAEGHRSFFVRVEQRCWRMVIER